jgi:glycosyltransferase involved in cell wall biosynthesis
MKVLHIVPGIERITGGPGRIAINLCNYLNLQGCDSYLLTTRDPLNRYELLDSNKIQDKIFFVERWSKETLAYSEELYSWMSCNARKYDIIHIHTLFNYPSLAASFCSYKAKVPYLIAPHGTLEDWSLSNKTWKKKIAYELIVKKQLKLAAALHATALPEAENFSVKTLNRKVFLVPNGIDEESLCTYSSPDIFLDQYPNLRGKKIIVFLGRIDPKKGLDLLAKAFSQVHGKFPCAHLVVVGAPTFDNVSFLGTAKSYFDLEGVGDAVTFTGMLSGNVKLSALAAASLYVAPSYSEGFSMSVLEGMSMGLPCIITKGCNFPEAQHADAAYVVDVSEQALANALLNCLTNPEQAEAVGNRAQKMINDHYTWKQVSSKLYSCYQEILSY